VSLYLTGPLPWLYAVTRFNFMTVTTCLNNLVNGLGQALLS